jgi:hypothetical protein
LPYLLLAVLVIGSGLGIGLGLSEAPRKSAIRVEAQQYAGTITTRLVLDRTRAHAGVRIKGHLVVQNSGPTINLTDIATSRSGRRGHQSMRRTHCTPGFVVELGNHHYQQEIRFLANCTPQSFLIHHGTTRLPVNILTTFTSCLQPGGSQVPSPTTIPPCNSGDELPLLPPGRYRTTVVWSEKVPIPSPPSVTVLITR